MPRLAAAHISVIERKNRGTSGSIRAALRDFSVFRAAEHAKVKKFPIL
jgi:hypothetical protein